MAGEKKISELPFLLEAKPNAYIPVIDQDEPLEANKNKRIFIGTLVTDADNNANVSVYETTPDEPYTNILPSIVSHAGNMWKYISDTPHDPLNPVVPGTNDQVWQLTSAGAFTHQPNTDAGTTQAFFRANRNNGNQNQEGSSGFEAASYDSGPIGQIRYYWDFGASTYKWQYCENVNTPFPVWVDFNLVATAKTRYQIQASADIFNPSLPVPMRGAKTFTQQFVNGASSISYDVTLEAAVSWVTVADIAALNDWIAANVTGSETAGTKYLVALRVNTFAAGSNTATVEIKG